MNLSADTPQPLKLLLIEDSENDAKLLVRALAHQGVAVNAHRVDTIPALKAALAEGNWDLVISDFQLPGFDGLESLRQVRACDMDLPFILTSGKVGEEIAVTAMREGANDFFLKDNLARLGPAIERELREAGFRRSQRAIEEERRRLHRAISQSPDAVLITDPTGGIVYANPAMEAISGYALPELMGKSPSVFKSGKQDRAFYQSLWETIGRGEVWRGIFVNRTKEGQYWEAEASISPLFDADGRLANFVCTQRNITHERTLQSQLELSQRREAIGVLAAGIAHDFNNVLTPILGRAELGLGRNVTDPGLRRDLEVIKISAQRASQLVQQILGFVRNQGQEVQAIEPHRLLNESLKMMRAVIPSTIQFEVQLDPATGFIQGDPTQLHQLLLNLCTNAAHAMKGGTGRLKVSLTKVTCENRVCVGDVQLPNGDYAELQISDTGCGMSPDILAQIFLPFFTTKSQGEGTGLGLSIVHGIVRSMGGGIQVESEEGRGTVFQLYFPVIPSPTPLETPSEEAVAHGQGRILVLDDEEAVIAFLEAILVRHGYQVTAFSDAETALTYFSHNPGSFDAVITDLTMPKLPGLELAQRIHHLRPGLPVVLMTGETLPGDFLAIHPGLVQAVLAKPFTSQQMARTLEGLLAPPAAT